VEGWNRVVAHVSNTPAIGAGMEVYFRSKVFEHPYAPYYDAYRGHKFKVIALHPGDHIQLECISDSSVNVNGHVHADELKQA
jgi:hypothetical protein